MIIIILLMLWLCKQIKKYEKFIIVGVGTDILERKPIPTDQTSGWDGTYKGVLAEVGSYAYQLEVELIMTHQ